VIRVLLADDQALVRSGFRVLLQIAGAGHGLDSPDQTPSPAQLTGTISAFLATTLH
jgi:DNA-binding NarL/FixJ family response regulator